MVYRLCLRSLGHRQDAEDAFRATFLVLAQNAHPIRKKASLASWLHGVAVRVASQAREFTVLHARSLKVVHKIPNEQAKGFSFSEDRKLTSSPLNEIRNRYLPV